VPAREKRFVRYSTLPARKTGKRPHRTRPRTRQRMAKYTKSGQRSPSPHAEWLSVTLPRARLVAALHPIPTSGRKRVIAASHSTVATANSNSGK
jgi:hypothetical protein